jgi:peptidoglycan-associated lipoprotein
MHKSIVAFAFIAVGCAHPPQVKESSLPVASKPAVQTASSSRISAATPTPGTCTTDLDCGSGQLCLNDHCTAISPGLAACTAVRVHFPFNSADLSRDDHDQLQRSARCLKADQALHVTVEGNADERGTEEYNLALGDRRAHAVAGYLEELGVTPEQLKTVSYGKDNPLCEQHDEACWSKNRRADLKLASATR